MFPMPFARCGPSSLRFLQSITISGNFQRLGTSVLPSRSFLTSIKVAPHQKRLVTLSHLRFASIGVEKVEVPVTEALNNINVGEVVTNCLPVDTATSFLSNHSTIAACVDFVQTGMIDFQAYFGLPFPVVILATAFAFRAVLAPLMLNLEKERDHIAKHNPKLKEMMNDIQTAKANGATMAETTQLQMEMMAYYRDNKISPFRFFMKSILPLGFIWLTAISITQIPAKLLLLGKVAECTALLQPFPMAMIFNLPLIVFLTEYNMKTQAVPLQLINVIRTIVLSSMFGSIFFYFYLPANIQYLIMGAMASQIVFGVITKVPAFRSRFNLSVLKPNESYYPYSTWIRNVVVKRDFGFELKDMHQVMSLSQPVNKVEPPTYKSVSFKTNHNDVPKSTEAKEEDAKIRQSS